MDASLCGGGRSQGHSAGQESTRPGFPIWSHSASHGGVHRADRPLSQLALPDTLTAVLLANPGASVTGAARLGHTDRAVGETLPPSRLRLPIPADPCTVLRITLALEARFALTPESSQNPFRRMHARYVA